MNAEVLNESPWGFRRILPQSRVEISSVSWGLEAAALDEPSAILIFDSYPLVDATSHYWWERIMSHPNHIESMRVASFHRRVL